MEELAAIGPYGFLGSWDPGGNTLAFVELEKSTEHDILLLHTGDRRQAPFVASNSCEMQPEFSPDGHWLAYTSNESGRYEIYVQPVPGPGGRWQISNEGGRDPLWSRDGKQMFYRYESGAYVVDVKTDGGFTAGKPRLLFNQAGYGSVESRSWDLSSDGRRFLMVRLEERKSQPVTEMILVQNWLEELKRLVPVK
jgi:Tol biopolymer transport system component